MRISTIKSEGIADLSYFVTSGEEAEVIDPVTLVGLKARKAYDFPLDYAKEE